MACEHCSTVFVFLPRAGLRRQYCSRTCKFAAYRGARHVQWGRGECIDARGYRLVRVDGKWRPEHITLAERALGRGLKRGEVVHHINGDGLDNRPSNLLVCTQAYHAALHGRMSRLYQREHFAGAA